MAYAKKEEMRVRWSRYEEYVGRGRGRPTRRSAHGNLVKSIILIAGKHGVDPELLSEAFIEAWTKEKSRLENLKITRRTVNKDSATFLITKGKEVVSQLPMALEVLENPEWFKAQIQEFLPFYRPVKKLSKKKLKIGDLRYGMKGFDVKGRILEVPPPLLVHTRFGTIADVSNVTVEDETGSIKLSLWNERIDQVRVGDEVELENCKVASYMGAPQLRLGRKGTLSIVDNEV